MGEGAVTSFQGLSYFHAARDSYAEFKAAFDDASPVTYVTRDDPSFLLIHGDKDDVVPVEQSEILRASLEKAAIPEKLIVVEGAGHSESFIPNYVPEILSWFETHLVRSEEPSNQRFERTRPFNSPAPSHHETQQPSSRSCP